MPFLGSVLRLWIVALLAAALPATWSIIIIDTRTGEIAIASATCLAGFDLEHEASVVVVGHGAAAAQSFVDDTGQNRSLIFTQLLAGTSPAQILAMLAASDPSHQTRQYGIVDVQGRAIGFTGTGDGQWAGHLTGQIGTLVYAIQGNVLTGQPVIAAAELALRTTPGDLADKLMAAMEAAGAMGGDGRCSCTPLNPTSCGSPPPSFTKSAHIGYMVVSRPGDTPGTCSLAAGCANGRFYMNINVANQQATSPDPLLTLRAQFTNWRLQHLLRPDHFLSTVALEPAKLLDDGQTTGTLQLVLRDWRGVRIPFGGAQVAVAAAAGSPPIAFGSVVDHGDGSYSVPVGPGSVPGIVKLRITVDDGVGAVQLAPAPELEVTSDALWTSRDGFDAVAGGTFDAVLRGGNALQSRGYLLLGSLSGTSPGVVLGPGLSLPLVPDALTFAMLDLAGGDSRLLGLLDGQGRHTSTFVMPPGLFAPYRGGHLDFAWLTLVPIDFTSNPVSLTLR